MFTSDDIINLPLEVSCLVKLYHRDLGQNTTTTDTPQAGPSEVTLSKVVVDAEFGPNDPYDTNTPHNKSHSATNADSATRTDDDPECAFENSFTCCTDDE